MKQKHYIWMIITLFLFSFWLDDAEAGVRYSRTQISVLTDAKNIADTFLCYRKDKKRECYDETLMGIILQESSGGIHKLGDDGASLGVAHVTVPAATDVINKCGTKKYIRICGFLSGYSTDKVQLTVMLTDNHFNMMVAAMYFRMQYDRQLELGNTLPWSRAIINYNCGFCADDMLESEIYSNKYRTNIKFRIKNIREFNRLMRVWV